ncbi:MAG TPA: iron-containing alcohol dehydrogenase PsrA [Alphaproteobacteria bacterium]|nr:iron-containing alcohol dehydrogenase PsrA [Alphaproteobacteria bacterium]
MWTYANPVVVHFAAGSLRRVGALVAGRPYALVTYDEPRFGGFARAIAATAGAPACIIDQVRPNPDFRVLTAACRALSATNHPPRLVLALGGGSVIDTAKVVAASNGDFAVVERRLRGTTTADGTNILPIIAVPTTAGTGSEVTCWATVWDTDRGVKYSLSDLALYPEHAVIDPELTLDAPAGLTVSTALDALSHALESLWNVNANPVSANFATVAARGILATLPALVGDLGNLALRSRIAEAALFAGLAFSNTRTALAHAISYGVTLRHGVPHGLACSFSLPRVMRSVVGHDRACDDALRQIFGADLAAGAQRLERFLVGLGVSVDPADYGVGAEEWRGLVNDALVAERGRNFIAPREQVLERMLAPAGAMPERRIGAERQPN